MPGGQKIFQNFCKISFTNHMKVFYLRLELPRDQEIKMTSQMSGCGFFCFLGIE